MEGSRLFKILCLLCVLIFELVLGRPKCTGRWAIHSCGGGNGKRSDIQELLGAESPSEHEPLPGYASELKAIGDSSRERSDYEDLPEDFPSLPSYPNSVDSSYEKNSPREELSDNNDRLERALNTLITRILLKKQQTDD